MFRKAIPKLKFALVAGLLISVVLFLTAGSVLEVFSSRHGQADAALRPQLASDGDPSAGRRGEPLKPSGQVLLPNSALAHSTSPTIPLTMPPDQRPEFERISVEHGLSQSSVVCILQDSKGFMWFGTQDGLNKYDGYDFTVYRHNPQDPDSLSHNIIQAIYEDRSGALWIGTWGGGLDRFDRDTERFTHFQHDPGDPNSLSNNSVLSIHQDQEGLLWVGTYGGGLNKFDPETESFVHYRNDPADPASLGGDFVRVIYEDRSGTLWIGAEDGGLDQFDGQGEQFVHYRHDASDPHSLSHHIVVSIYEDQEGLLWVGTADGLNRYDRDTGKFTIYKNDPNDPGSLSDNVVLSLHQDHSGVLWVGTRGGGLDQFDRSSGRFVHYRNEPNDPNSLSNDVVLSIYSDRSGVLWIGTNAAGLNKLDRSTQRFLHYQHQPDNPHSLSDNMVRSIFQDRSGVLWIGTSGGGLNAYDRASGAFTRYPRNSEEFESWDDRSIYALYEDRAGRLWVGTEEGLYTFDRDTETFKRWMTRSVVTFIYEDRAQILWVGTLGGLTRLGQARRTVKNYIHDPSDPYSLSSSGVRAIAQDRLGLLWIGTDAGVDGFDRETERFTRHQESPYHPGSLSDDFVLSIHEDRSGVLWIGTYGGGLNRFDRDAGTFRHYREKDGLPSDAIYGILEDDQGHLWLSTNVGLSRFDPRTETFRNYDVRDGLQSNEFNSGAYHKSSSGEMFFGGINGFNAFHPGQVKDNPYIPPVVLTSLTQGGEEVEVEKALENVTEVAFNWPNNFFEFEFAALSYCQPDRNEYAYRLEGFEDDWNYISTRRFGRYTNLPAGTYTLRVRGSNNDGFWNTEGASLQVTVVSPFWATWWFRGIVALILLVSIAGGYRLRVSSIESRSRELEGLVEARTRALERRTFELEQRTRESERRRQELEALYRADERMRRHLHLDQVLQALVDVAVDILQADKSAVLVWDERRERLVVRVIRGFRPESMAHLSFAKEEGVTGTVAATGEPILMEDTLTDPRRGGERAEIVEVVLAEGIRSFMHLPIRIGDEVFAVFNVSFAEPHAFGENEQRLFTALAQRAALAIENAQLYEQAQQLAAVEERSRLARDLHDAVTQTLFSSSLIAEALPTLWENDPQEGQQLLKELRQLSRGALAEMRTLLLELRPAALVEASLSDLLRQLGEAVTGRKGVPVTVTVEGECVIPDDLHVALYRIAQEALNNVVKHARASEVAVSLRCDSLGIRGEGGGAVELCISDDGRGFDPGCVPPDRLGLGIIRERAQAVGARLEIKSQPGLGTRVKVRWEEDER